MAAPAARFVSIAQTTVLMTSRRFSMRGPMTRVNN